MTPPPFSRNEEAAPDDRLVGAKRAAVQTVLDFAPEVREQLFGIISVFGWEGNGCFGVLKKISTQIKKSVPCFKCCVFYTSQHNFDQKQPLVRWPGEWWLLGLQKDITRVSICEGWYQRHSTGVPLGGSWKSFNQVCLPDVWHGEITAFFDQRKSSKEIDPKWVRKQSSCSCPCLSFGLVLAICFIGGKLLVFFDPTSKFTIVFSTINAIPT